MAFPFIFESNFETGDTTEWTTGDTDSANQLDVAHYTELARSPDTSLVPYAGAYALRAQLTGGTADAFAEVDEVDITLAATRYVAFDFLISKDFAATSDDIFNICELVSTSNAVENAVSLQIIASTDIVTIGIGQTAASAFTTFEIEKGLWYTAELVTTPATGGAGVLDLYVTRNGDVAASSVAVSQITSMTNLAVTEGRLGIMNHLATTTGTILYDRFIFDDTGRVYPGKRYSYDRVFTKSGHVFVGSGWVKSAGLLTDESTNVMRLWDTDTGDINAAQDYIVEFDIDGTFTAKDGPIFFQKGCYVQLTGTNPRGQVSLVRGKHTVGVYGPKAYSDNSVRALVR